jgi:hypothetical protein
MLPKHLEILFLLPTLIKFYSHVDVEFWDDSTSTFPAGDCQGLCLLDDLHLQSSLAPYNGIFRPMAEARLYFKQAMTFSSDRSRSCIQFTMAFTLTIPLPVPVVDLCSTWTPGAAPSKALTSF